jgi:hypothetical protein
VRGWSQVLIIILQLGVIYFIGFSFNLGVSLQRHWNEQQHHRRLVQLLSGVEPSVTGAFSC